MDNSYWQDRHSFELRKLPIELHRKIYSYIHVDVMVHEWMYSCDLNDIIHTICDCDYNALSVISLYELYQLYDRNAAKLFIWRHTIPEKEKRMGYWYNDEITDYYKMGNDYIKMLTIEYGKLLETKNQEKMEKLYKILSVLIYMYKNPTKTFIERNTKSS
jgi:hypothetical protein